MPEKSQIIMKKNYLIVSFIMVCLASCIFTPEKENFVEINQNVEAPIVENQTIDFNSDTLFVYKRTKFSFNFISSNQEIIGVSITYGEHNLSFTSATGDFEINPITETDGIYTLTVKTFTHSGTSSLADKINNEGFVFERSCILIIETPKAPSNQISTSVENGFLKISWNKLNKTYFQSYALAINNEGIAHSYDFKTEDKNITSFIDSFYVGGEISITLWTNYYDVEGSINSSISYFNLDIPLSLKFQELNDSLILSWGKNPFKCKRLFSMDSSDPIEIDTDTSYSLLSPGLGNPIQYCVSFLPLKKAHYDHQRYYLYANYTEGINDGNIFSAVDYNRNMSTFFIKYPMYIKGYRQNDFQVTGSYNYFWDYYDDVCLAFSTDGKVIWSTEQRNLIQLNAADLTLIQSTPLPMTDDFGPTMHAMKYINDSTLLLGLDSKFVIYNSKKNNIVAQTEMLKGYGPNFDNNYAISADGKYVAFFNSSGLIVYKNIDNKRFELKYEDSKTYYGILFDLNNPERLILDIPDDYLIWNCETSQVEGNIENIKGNIINIDPVTHFLFSVSYINKKIYVYDLESKKVRYVANSHGYPSDFRLINETVFVKSGYHFTIPAYIN
jgi:hypothetical protein